jgi:ubiquinone/menaquinone biosynthesis C-methylase UbiE
VSGVKEHILRYWNARAESYDKSPGHAGLQGTWKKLLSRVFEKKSKILDVGTGTGFLALILSELGHEVTGVDLSPRMLEIARKKALESGQRIDFKLGDAETLPFKNNSFDAVICRHLLWTLPNPTVAVSEWRRVVKKGGKVVVIDGCWFDRSLRSGIRRFIGRLGIALYEKKSPFANCYPRQVNRALPLYGDMNHEKVVEIFERAMLTRISVQDLNWIKDAVYREQPFVYRLAWGSRGYFLIEGYKEVEI